MIRRELFYQGQRTEGVEVSLSGQLTSDWNVMGGYAYQIGEFTSDIQGIAKKVPR